MSQGLHDLLESAADVKEGRQTVSLEDIYHEFADDESGANGSKRIAVMVIRCFIFATTNETRTESSTCLIIVIIVVGGQVLPPGRAHDLLAKGDGRCGGRPD
jgi:hypothetical protein